MADVRLHADVYGTLIVDELIALRSMAVRMTRYSFKRERGDIDGISSRSSVNYAGDRSSDETLCVNPTLTSAMLQLKWHSTDNEEDSRMREGMLCKH